MFIKSFVLLRLHCSLQANLTCSLIFITLESWQLESAGSLWHGGFGAREIKSYPESVHDKGYKPLSSRWELLLLQPLSFLAACVLSRSFASTQSSYCHSNASPITAGFTCCVLHADLHSFIKSKIICRPSPLVQLTFKKFWKRREKHKSCYQGHCYIRSRNRTDQ